jgi:hypothetical protein
LDVSDHLLLLPVDPASQSHEKKLPGLERFHERDSTAPKLRTVTPCRTRTYPRLSFWTLRPAIPRNQPRKDWWTTRGGGPDHA